jgi:hypothetical protein
VKRLALLALAATLAPLPVAAQTAPVAAAAPVDPARLTAARKLIDKIAPPEKRDAMVEQIVRPMMANMRRSMEQSPEFATSFAEKPELKKQMFEFLDAETEHSMTVVRQALPAMWEAMATAYARRFTLDQLAEIGRFFDTPTGRYYAEQAPTIMTDPAVQDAQRAMMAKSFEGLQDRVRAMTEKMQAAAKKESGS